jgi:hypothetical protein
MRLLLLLLLLQRQRLLLMGNLTAQDVYHTDGQRPHVDLAPHLQGAQPEAIDLHLDLFALTQLHTTTTTAPTAVTSHVNENNTHNTQHTARAHTQRTGIGGKATTSSHCGVAIEFARRLVVTTFPLK